MQKITDDKFKLVKPLDDQWLSLYNSEEQCGLVLQAILWFSYNFFL